jgi:hypothetical protein
MTTDRFLNRLAARAFGRWTVGLVLVVLGGSAAPAPSQAQAARPAFASAFVPSHHWATHAARRLSAMGITDRAFAWGDGSITAREVGLALWDAWNRADGLQPGDRDLVIGYWERFRMEFPETAALLDTPEAAGLFGTEGSAVAGFAVHRGRVSAGRATGEAREDFSDPIPLDNVADVGFDGRIAGHLGRHVAAEIGAERRNGDWRLGESYGVLAWKKLSVWGGRRAPRFGPGQGGGLLFNGAVAFDGGGFSFTEPIRLPWILRHVGAIRAEMFLSRIDSSAAIRHPWVMGARVSLSPHPRVLLAVNQAAMFSGEGLPPFTWRNFKEMFFSHGVNVAGTEFENGLASAEVRVRPPLPLPMVLYMEWAADDNHAAWSRFPGVLVGIELPSVPGLPALDVGVEHTSFARPCNDSCVYYATWYRHYLFKDGWTVHREPIGHPLGGHGYEWRAFGRWDEPGGTLRLSGHVFLRQRGSYNIFAATRGGRSHGAIAAAELLLNDRLLLRVDGALERGSRDWTESQLFIGARRVF